MQPIDLRSDVKSLPTEAMLRAMCEAPLGDEQAGEDPTVVELEDMIATMLGHERAIFVPSATMANQIAVLSQVRPGEEILAQRDSHVFRYEAGGPAALAGAVLTGLDGPDGWISGAQVAETAQGTESEHRPRTALVVIENTHNTAGGRPWPLAALEDLHRACAALGLPVHVDGSRLFNAAVALGVKPAELTRRATTVSICFSKGLGCPAGAALVGTSDALADARRIRQRLGGALRQAGVLAGAAVYALRNNVSRLAEDHEAARTLAGLLQAAGLAVDGAKVETNFVMLDLAAVDITRDEAHIRLAAEGVLWSNSHFPSVLRAVTYRDVADSVAEAAARTIRALCA
jgi:threonine aldolase